MIKVNLLRKKYESHICIASGPPDVRRFQPGDKVFGLTMDEEWSICGIHLYARRMEARRSCLNSCAYEYDEAAG